MKRLVRPPAFFLVLVMALGLAACGGDATEPPPAGEDLLTEFDAIAFGSAIRDRMEIALESAGAADIFWFALRSLGADFGGQPSALRPRAMRAPRVLSMATGVRPMATIPSAHYGRTFIYDSETQEWLADDGRTGAPGDGIRVTWYQTFQGGMIAVPLVERGHIDLRDLPGGQGARLNVTVVSTDLGGPVAEYVLELDEVETANTWSAALDIAGNVANLEKSLAVVIGFEGYQDTATDEDRYDYDFALSESGFLYEYEVVDRFDAATSTYHEEVDVQATIGGVTARVEFTGTEPEGSAYTIAAAILLDGVKVADVELAAFGLQFTHPEGGILTAAEQEKLDTIFWSLFGWLGIINIFFG